ncbi:MAG: recombinase family protein [Thermaceae bacterium]|nr:recombinase family protein [Thermaceae bacterium]
MDSIDPLTAHHRGTWRRGDPCQAQPAALKKAGLKDQHIFLEKISSRRWDRPELCHALDALREGDVPVM